MEEEFEKFASAANAVCRRISDVIDTIIYPYFDLAADDESALFSLLQQMKLVLYIFE
jgi:hypothetical protein